jgi:hypothetical protein
MVQIKFQKKIQVKLHCSQRMSEIHPHCLLNRTTSSNQTFLHRYKWQLYHQESKSSKTKCHHHHLQTTSFQMSHHQQSLQYYSRITFLNLFQTKMMKIRNYSLKTNMRKQKIRVKRKRLRPKQNSPSKVKMMVHLHPEQVQVNPNLVTKQSPLPAVTSVGRKLVSQVERTVKYMNC